MQTLIRSRSRRRLSPAVLLLLGLIAAVAFGWIGPRPGWTQDVQYCTKCGTENPADARFCTRCGEPLFQEFMRYLVITDPKVNLYLGDTGNEQVMGTADKGTVLNFQESGTGRYRATLDGKNFWVTVWIDKAAAERRMEQETAGISEPLTARETSELLERYKRDKLKLFELRKNGYRTYQNAIQLFISALNAEESGTEGRQRAQRYREMAEESKRRQDRFLTIFETYP